MVTPEDVRRIAELAALELEPGEVDALARELTGILEHFAAIRDVDTDDVPAFGAGGRAPLRADEPDPDRLAAPPGDGAPGWEAGLFTVPRLASHAEDGPP